MNCRTPSPASWPSAPLKVTVVDALMGSGKTTLALRLMRDIALSYDTLFEYGQRRFIYITPFLDEVSRVEDALNEFTGQRIAFTPIPEGGRKLVSLNRMILEGQNIVSTHALFKFIDEATGDALDQFRYTLFVDEVAEWVEKYPISSKDLKILFDAGCITTDPATKQVRWVDPDEGYQGKFDSLRSLCRQGKIVASRHTSGGMPTLLLWRMPVEILSRFDEVVILTHLFDGSDMAAYLRLSGVEIEKKTIGRDGEMVPYEHEIEAERIARIRPLLQIETDPKLNAVGTRTGRNRPLSVTWFRTDRAKLGGHLTKKLQHATYTFFRYRCGTPVGQNLWATFKDYRKDLKGKGYGRSFLSCNARATNDYRDRVSLAYLVNLYRHPFISGYFKDAGVPTSEDFYALATMTQWVFRSAIRVGKPVRLFVPSDRMRRLLTDWLDGKLPAIPSTADASDSDDADTGELDSENAKEADDDNDERVEVVDPEEQYA